MSKIDNNEFKTIYKINIFSIIFIFIVIILLFPELIFFIIFFYIFLIFSWIWIKFKFDSKKKEILICSNKDIIKVLQSKYFNNSEKAKQNKNIKKIKLI